MRRVLQHTGYSPVIMVSQNLAKLQEGSSCITLDCGLTVLANTSAQVMLRQQHHSCAAPSIQPEVQGGARSTALAGCPLHASDRAPSTLENQVCFMSCTVIIKDILSWIP